MLVTNVSRDTLHCLRKCYKDFTEPLPSGVKKLDLYYSFLRAAYKKSKDNVGEFSYILSKTGK